MTDLHTTTVRASRLRVPRSRGALSGLLLVVLGAWAGIVTFIGPYFDVCFLPDPNSTWHWTTDRLWLAVLPGAAAFLGGLIVLASANRVTVSLGGWLAAAGGAWLVVGQVLAAPLGLQATTPDPASGQWLRAVDTIVGTLGIGVVIVCLSALALGRLSVHSLRDVRAAERRLESQEALDAQDSAQDTARTHENHETIEHHTPHHAAG